LAKFAKSAKVAEKGRSYSSVWNNNAKGTGHARSMLNSVQGWSAQKNSAGQWMQIDLGKVKSVAGTVIQSRVGNLQYVTKYNAMYSRNGKQWFLAGSFTGIAKGKTRAIFRKAVRARYVRFVVIKWKGHVSMRADVLLDTNKSDGCTSKMVTNPSESKRMYSSVYANNAKGTGYARSMLNSAQGWSAKKNSAGQWMQIDLGKVKSVAGTVIEPRVGNGQYVTAYTVKYSTDGRKWHAVPGTHFGLKKQTRSLFRKAIRARYVRLIAQKWKGHISMRAALLLKVKGCRIAGSAPIGCSSRSTAKTPEKLRAYSSTWNNNAKGTGHARSMLNSAQAWSAKKNSAGQWMQIDLGKVKSVAGTVIEPRVGNGQYVTAYTVKYSTDGRKWHAVAGTYYGRKGRKVTSLFPKKVTARYVRLIVQKWQGHISMRADAVICSPKKKV